MVTPSDAGRGTQPDRTGESGPAAVPTDYPLPCPACGAQHWQRYVWKPDKAPTRERHQCYVCGWDSGWTEVGESEASGEGNLASPAPRAKPSAGTTSESLGKGRTGGKGSATASHLRCGRCGQPGKARPYRQPGFYPYVHQVAMSHPFVPEGATEDERAELSAFLENELVDAMVNTHIRRSGVKVEEQTRLAVARWERNQPTGPVHPGEEFTEELARKRRRAGL